MCISSLLVWFPANKPDTVHQKYRKPDHYKIYRSNKPDKRNQIIVKYTDPINQIIIKYTDPINQIQESRSL
jgi:hypothetical protein